MNRTLNLNLSQWLPCVRLHPLELQTYEITPCGALGGSETYENAAFGALRGCKPMKLQHAAPMELSLGLQSLCGYSMRRPWGLPFLDTVAFS